MFKKLDFKFYKTVLLVAMPVMLQQFISAFAQVIDNLMIGSLGADAIAAVGASNSIFTVVMVIGYGVSEGATVFGSQQFGAKQYNQMTKTFILSLVFALFFGFLSFMVIRANGSFFLQLYNLDGQRLTYGIQYITVVSLSYIFIILNGVVGSAIRSTGRTKIPLFCGMIAIASNTVLNYSLIYGNLGLPALGVEGAALATVLARIIESTLLVIAVVGIKAEFTTNFFQNMRKISLNFIAKFTQKTLVLISNEFLWGFGMATLMTFYGSRSSDDLVSMQIASTTSNLMFSVMSGFAVSVSIFIGQQLGKNKLKEARENATKILILGVLVGFVITIITMISSFFTPYLFNVSDEIRMMSSWILRIIALAFPLYLFTVTIFFTLRAGGDVRGVFVMDSMAMWVITIPLAWAVVNFTELPMIYIYLAVQSTELLKAVIGYHRFRQEKWLKNLTHKNDVPDLALAS